PVSEVEDTGRLVREDQTHRGDTVDGSRREAEDDVGQVIVHGLHTPHGTSPDSSGEAGFTTVTDLRATSGQPGRWKRAMPGAVTNQPASTGDPGSGRGRPVARTACSSRFASHSSARSARNPLISQLTIPSDASTVQAIAPIS